jgi:hypothetical protein
VLAFYDTDSGDAAHNEYVKEALTWFPQTGAQNGFSWQAPPTGAGSPATFRRTRS